MSDVSAWFNEWLGTTAPGSRFVYHEGYLHEDRSLDRTLSTYAIFILAAENAGLVHLVQRRTDNGFQYIVVRSQAEAAKLVADDTKIDPHWVTEYGGLRSPRASNKRKVA